MEAYIIDWLDTMVRFAHFVTGIAWIGASFYFNWLENSLNREEGQKEEISGHLWAVHGGGFYYLEKYKGYPNKLPKPLHWFKWEAYFTLITGLSLFVIVYYYNASSYLVKASSDLSPSMGIIASIAGLIIGWLIYDFISKSKLVHKQNFVALIMLAVVFISAVLYNQIFTPRAVFYQIGAMIGTIMVLNVFFVIIPSQRELVKACVEKTSVGEQLVFKGYTRSRNNNYFTLPVLFIMLSSHFSIFYSSQVYAPLMLVLIFVVTVLIRHYFNLEGEKKPGGGLALGLAGIIMIATFFALMPKTVQVNSKASPVTLSEVKSIIKQRCATCHSINPSDKVFTTAPTGFILDTTKQIIASKNMIYAKSVASEEMPFMNKTNMTQKERDKLALWIQSQK